MSDRRFAQTVSFLYLILSGHVLVDCRRVDSARKKRVMTAESKAVSHAELQEQREAGHPWCNPFSSLSTRSYHFDIELSQDHCEDGQCMALELVRHSTDPTLEVHMGQEWSVKPKDGSEDFEWELYKPNPNNPVSDKSIDLTAVELIKFFPADEDKQLPDKLEITLGDSNGTQGTKQRNLLSFEGGIYYDEYLLGQGLERVNRGDFEKMTHDAAQETYTATGSRIGSWVGGTGTVLTVGGFYTAATLTGAAVQTQALIGAAAVGVVGGTVAGAVLGGVVGVGIAAGVMMFGTHSVRGYKVTPASRKIFEKIRCIPEFKECDDNVLVPEEKDCPRK